MAKTKKSIFFFPITLLTRRADHETEGFERKLLDILLWCGVDFEVNKTRRRRCRGSGEERVLLLP